MKVHIDPTLCTALGVCESIRPDIFEVRNDGLVHLITEDFSEADRRDLEEAVYQCPVQALRLQG